MEPFRYQETADGCGWACLRMMAASLHHASAWLVAPCAGQGACSGADLCAEAPTFGLSAKGFRVHQKAYLKRLDTPFMAHGKVQGHGHFIIVDRRFMGGYLVRDPDRGRRWMSGRAFMRYFDGVVLTFTVSDATVKPPVIPLTVAKKDRVIIRSGQLLAGFCLLGGFYFIDAGASFLWPVSLLTLGALLSLGVRAWVFRAMRHVDERYLYPSMPHWSGPFLSAYQDYQKVKSDRFAHLISGTTRLGAALAILVVLGLNGWDHLFIAGLAILGVILSQRWETLRLASAHRHIGADEEAAAEAQKKGAFTDSVAALQRANAGAFRVTFRSEAVRTVGRFLLLAMALVAMALRGIASLNYLIFHFLAYVFLSEQVAGFLRQEGHVRGNLEAESRFYAQIMKK